jgi:hypothetical protein
MKKLLFITASALALFASCSSETDSVSPNAPDAQPSNVASPIAFGTYLSNGASTRAGATGAINTTDQLKASAGFGVFAYYTQDKDYDATGESQTPNWMYNQKVAWDVTKSDWMYSPLKYWPNDNGTADNQGATGTTTSKVSFFAYAPFTGDEKTGALAAGETSGITAFSASDAAGHPTVTYRLSKDGKEVDLLWGTAPEGKSYETVTGSNVTVGKVTDALAPTNINIQKLKTGGKVAFLFKHALAKFGGSNETTKTNPDGKTETVTTTNGLQVKLDIDKDGAITGGDKDAATKVTIKTIEIKNSNATGTVEDLNGDGAADDNDKIASGGTFDLATGKWTPLTEYIDIDHTITSPGSTKGEGSETERSNATIADNLAEPATVETGTDGWDKLPAGVTTDAQNVYKEESNPLVFIPGTKPSFKITVEYVVRTKDAHLAKGYTEAVQKITHNVAFKDAVELNKKYNLLIHLGLTSVKFEATVSNWDLDSTPAGTGTEDSDGDGTKDNEDTTYDVHVPINVQ